MQKALLLLEDGTVFEGQAHGSVHTVSGEICFTTSMAGYYETLTDPSYANQVVVFTHTHIGNYGVIESLESESTQIQCKAFVCKNFSEIYSPREGAISLQKLLDKQNIPAISGIDTRILVRKIRTKGAMNAVLSTDAHQTPESLRAIFKDTPTMEGLGLAHLVSTPSPYTLRPQVTPTATVAVIDYGMKKSIAEQLLELACLVKVFPQDTPPEVLLAEQPDGILLSNGPGDPAAMKQNIVFIQKLLEANIPMMGICLGYQLLGLAVGCNTYKMHHGHRGSNHPVKNLINNRCEITSQNHGFAISPEYLPQNIKITHINLNDQTLEGFQLTDKPAFGVQYHPEASPGPHDSRYLFQQFLQWMKN